MNKYLDFSLFFGRFKLLFIIGVIYVVECDKMNSFENKKPVEMEENGNNSLADGCKSAESPRKLSLLSNLKGESGERLLSSSEEIEEQVMSKLETMMSLVNPIEIKNSETAETSSSKTNHSDKLSLFFIRVFVSKIKISYLFA